MDDGLGWLVKDVSDVCVWWCMIDDVVDVDDDGM